MGASCIVRGFIREIISYSVILGFVSRATVKQTQQLVAMNKEDLLAALNESYQQILDQVDRRLESLKRDLQEDQEVAANKIVKKVKE